MCQLSHTNNALGLRKLKVSKMNPDHTSNECSSIWDGKLKQGRIRPTFGLDPSGSGQPTRGAEPAGQPIGRSDAARGM